MAGSKEQGCMSDGVDYHKDDQVYIAKATLAYNPKAEKATGELHQSQATFEGLLGDLQGEASVSKELLDYAPNHLWFAKVNKTRQKLSDVEGRPPELVRGLVKLNAPGNSIPHN
ncbi:hypothetical protein BGZ46_000476 [Entomortierella lignicola]|nr:hypothetical protein BGZ46_000476 [Entomortierella lignicola]